MYMTKPTGRLVKSIMLLFVGLALSQWSNAGWTPYIENANGDVSFVDKTTLKRRNGIARVWILVDYAQPTNGAASGRFYYEANCKEGTLKVLEGAAFGEIHAKGQVIDVISKPVNLGHSYPGSVTGNYYEFLCGKS